MIAPHASGPLHDRARGGQHQGDQHEGECGGQDQRASTGSMRYTHDASWQPRGRIQVLRWTSDRATVASGQVITPDSGSTAAAGEASGAKTTALRGGCRQSDHGRRQWQSAAGGRARCLVPNLT